MYIIIVYYYTTYNIIYGARWVVCVHLLGYMIFATHTHTHTHTHTLAINEQTYTDS